jgi:ribose-phosphate pyrophosphokinase
MIKINGKEVKTFNFSAGEVNPTLPEGLKAGVFNITAFLQSSDAVMNLIMVIDALKRNYGDYPIKLFVPYLPYSRQDRLCNKDEAIGLEVILDLLSSRVDTVTTLDVHNLSACRPKNINLKINNISCERLISGSGAIGKNTVLVAPDAGSRSRVYIVAKDTDTDFIQGNKHRDTATGALSHFSVDTFGVACEGKDLLIIDDICDGGGTFIGLYDELVKLKPKKIDLYVTHGIFSKGYEKLLSKFDTIYTTNSFMKTHHEDIKIIKVIDDV